MLPDGKTLIGPDSSGTAKLVAEDLSTNKSRLIKTLGNFIRTVLYDPETRSLFAGDHDGHLLQFQGGQGRGVSTGQGLRGHRDFGGLLFLSEWRSGRFRGLWLALSSGGQGCREGAGRGDFEDCVSV
ncbi:MAG: hypothetical protein AAFO91_18320, partial [Bacteroidota bacterium]